MKPDDHPRPLNGLRITSGIVLLLAAAFVLVVAQWLHQPGFVGDPEARLLEGVGYAGALFVSLGLAVAGLVLLATSRR